MPAPAGPRSRAGISCPPLHARGQPGAVAAGAGAELGADVVLHSSTKYFGGHSDVQGGALVFARRDATFERVEHIRHVLGAVASPFGCWLVLRGLRTLPCRMERHSANAQAIADALLGYRALDAVLYPGLPSHPGHEVAWRQMKSFGGMLSLRVKGGRAKALEAASPARRRRTCCGCPSGSSIPTT